MGKGRRNRQKRREDDQADAPGISERAQKLMFDRMQRGYELMSATAPDEIPEALEARRRKVLELCDGFDALDVIGNLAFSVMPLAGDRYVESEATGSAADVELATAILLARPEAGAPNDQGLIDGNLLDPLRETLSEVLILMVLRGYASAARDVEVSVAEAQTRARASAQHLWLRGPGFTWQEEETVRDLFAPPVVAGDLKRVLGFDAEEALACSDAVGQLVEQRLNERMDVSLEIVAQVEKGERPPQAEWAEKVLHGWENLPPHMRGVLMATIWTFHDIPGWMSVTVEDVAAASNVDSSAVAAFLERFSLAFGDVELDLLRAMEEVRSRPLVRVDDAYFPVLPGAELWAMRPTFEAALEGDGGATKRRYYDRRGKWLERAVADLLERALQPDEVKTSLGYRIGEGDGLEQGEIDVLLRLDDTLLVVEAKSASLPISGRRGGQSLIQHLRKHLTKAAKQGTRAREAVLGEAQVEFFDDRNQPVELGTSRIREVHPIVVTLDDLSVVGPVLWELQGSRVMPEGVTLPWVVTWHDLELIAELVEHPVQLVHFLRRRARLNQIGGKWASDELDWWMLYLHSGLYYEDESEEPRLTRYASMTDSLDAWFMFQKGLRGPAPKPTQQLRKDTVALLKFLEEHRPPGWVAASSTWLGMARGGQNTLLDRRNELRRLAGRRNRVQRETHTIDEPGGTLLCMVAVPASDRSLLEAHLRRYVGERLEEMEARRVLALGVSAGRTEPLEAMLVIEPGVWELPSDS